MKENGQMEQKWDKDFINGKTEISTVETLQMIQDKEEESIDGKMGLKYQHIGGITNSMEKLNILSMEILIKFRPQKEQSRFDF